MKVLVVNDEQPEIGPRALLPCKPTEPMFRPECVPLVCDRCGTVAAGRVVLQPLPSHMVIARHLCADCERARK